MNRTFVFASIIVAASLATPALADNTTPAQPQTSSQASTNSNHDLVAAQKIQQDLKSAGFTDVKVVAESFVVQAKSKDGNPVVMTIGPHGMSVFESLNTNTTGSVSGTTTQGSTMANPSHQSSSK